MIHIPTGAAQDSASPASIPDLLNEAIAHHQAGRLAQAERLYVQILNMDAHNPDCYHLLGLISFHVGNLDSAIILISKAIDLCGHIPTFHYSLGNVFIAAGRHDEAAACYTHTLDLQPDHALAHNNLGVFLLIKGRNDEALTHFDKTAALLPDFPDTYNNKGKALMNKGLFAEAAAAFRQAIACNPNYAEAHNNLGTAIRSLTEQETETGATLDTQSYDKEALAHYLKATEINPGLAEAHNNAALLLKESGQFEEARKFFEQAARLNPDYADAHWNLSLVLLTLGDMQNGWREYEWRWRRKGMPPHAFVHLPLWDGSDFKNKTLLLHCEQGFGDNLHFIRYAPMVKERGGKVILACYKPLLRLFESVQGIDEIYPLEGTLPPADLQAPLLSLPMIFGTTLETVPANIPYLAASVEDTTTWAMRLRPYNGFKVGLVWSGNTSAAIAGTRAIYRRRSLHLDQLTPLADVPGITWFSLQKDDPEQQGKTPPPGMDLIDLMEHVNDFADTAAFIANLDMVIGIDTSVIHLAGALGKPVWVLSPFDGCWRYLLKRDNSPWYPTMRLFRQPVSREWPPAITEVRKAMASNPGKN